MDMEDPECSASESFFSYLETMRSGREYKSDHLDNILSSFSDAAQKHKFGQQFSRAEMKLEQIRKTRQQTNQHLNAKLYSTDPPITVNHRQPFVDAHEYQNRMSILDEFASSMNLESSDGSVLKRSAPIQSSYGHSLHSTMKSHQSTAKSRTVRFDLESNVSPKLYHSNSLISMHSNLSNMNDDSPHDSRSNSALLALNASHRNLSERSFGLESFNATTEQQMRLHKQSSQASIFREHAIQKSHFHLWCRYVKAERQLGDDLQYQICIKRAFKEWKRRHLQIYQYQRRVIMRRWKVAVNKEKEFVNEITRYPARSRRTYLLMITSLRWIRQKLPAEQFERLSQAWHRRYAKIVLLVLFSTWKKPIQDRHTAVDKVFSVLRETNRDLILTQLREWQSDARQSRALRKKRFLILEKTHKNNIKRQRFAKWYRLCVARSQIRMALFQWANKAQFRIFEMWKKYATNEKRKREIIERKSKQRILRQSFDWWVSAYIRIREEYNPPHTQLFLPTDFPPNERTRMQNASRLHQCQLIGTVIRFHR